MGSKIPEALGSLQAFVISLGGPAQVNSRILLLEKGSLWTQAVKIVSLN